ncbi:MAG TPA: fatty acid--CoA ligase [Acidocella sp.]|nr:fatty acid--CoA ligase [Acidocella sp.]
MNDGVSVTGTRGQTVPLLIKELLRIAMGVTPAGTISYAERSRYSYATLNERIHRLGSALSGLGLRHGMTVGVMDWDTPRYLECFFAVPMMGAVLHTINVRLSPEQILYTINHAEDDIILVNGEFLPILEKIWERVDPGKTLVLLNDAAVAPATGLPLVGEYEALLAAAPPAFDFPDFDEATRATTFYTTGTTGLPKGVFFSHRQLVLHTLALRAGLGGAGQGRFNAEDVYMPVTPMFHVHAWGIPYLATMLGAKQVYPGRYAPDLLARLIKTEGVSFSHCVPTVLQMILDAAQRADISLRGWKVVIGGSALPRALCLEALARGIDVFTGYGMSETCPVLTIAQLPAHMLSWPIEQQADARCKAGRAFPMVQIRVVDEQMDEVPSDGETRGEVVARAPWLTAGYLKDPASSAALWAGGWLHTGDVAVREPDGTIKITDRIKDVIKTGGEWVSSIDVEDLILRHPGVAEVAVIGVSDPKWGETPLAIVVAKPGQAVTADEIRVHLASFADRGIISRYAVPGRVEFVEQLPKTSVGKLNKRVLRETHTSI